MKFASSSISPPVPAITTRLFVKSSTITVLAVIPPLASTLPVNVDIPLTSNLLVVVTPVILTPNWSITLTSVPSSSSRVILSPAILKSPTVSLI